MRFFFISSSHLEDGIWFRVDDDFKTGMNYVAVSALACGVTVWAFVLMSNHVHFVVEGDPQKIEQFILKFKQLYSTYYRRKYGVNELLRRNAFDVREVSTDNESLEKAVAYVLMNPVAANICLSASDYPWGSGSCCFSVKREKGTPAKEMSFRELRRLIRSEYRVPPQIEIGEDGYILPRSYVPVAWLESLFRTPKRLAFFLNSSSKARARLESTPMPSFTDQLLLSGMKEICVSLFRQRDLNDLTRKETALLLTEVKRRFSPDVKQLALT